MDLQYHHNQHYYVKSTVVVDVPLKEDFCRLLADSLIWSDLIMKLPIGFVRCHPDDQYNKKIGRQYSKERIKQVICELGGINKHNGIFHITLYPVTECEISYIQFEIKPDRERVYFTNISLTEAT